MLEFGFSFLVILLAFTFLGLGQLGGRKGISGSCGGSVEHCRDCAKACWLVHCPGGSVTKKEIRA